MRTYNMRKAPPADQLIATTAAQCRTLGLITFERIQFKIKLLLILKSRKIIARITHSRKPLFAHFRFIRNIFHSHGNTAEYSIIIPNV